MFDVGCLFGKEQLEVNPIFGSFGIVLPGITWQVEQSIVLDDKVCREKDVFLSEWLFSSF